MNNFELWMDPKKCKGCLRCELVCSYHKSEHKLFKPALSSTKVLRSNENKVITMIIDETCDFCESEDEDFPLCVKYCVFGARGVVK